MLTLKEWMELVDFRITEGSEFYTDEKVLYNLTSWNEKHDGWSFNIVFDPKDNQKVYVVEVCDYKNNRAYRMSIPDYKESSKQAWDDINFIDLESDDDFIQKSQAIRAGKDYDTRVSIPIDLPEDELLFLFKAAHEKDMTFNDFVEDILVGALADEEFIGTLKSRLASKQ